MTTATTHGTDPERLVKMANQIGGFFKSYPDETAVEGVREHIAKFWNRKMRSELFAAIDAGTASGLSPLVEKAVAKLR